MFSEMPPYVPRRLSFTLALNLSQKASTVGENYSSVPKSATTQEQDFGRILVMLLRYSFYNRYRFYAKAVGVANKSG